MRGTEKMDPMSENTRSAEVQVNDPMGLHGRPAALLVQIASKYASRIELSRPDAPDEPADCHSILSLLVLAAAKDTILRLVATGPDADAAVEEIVRFFNGKFDE